jgi:hypothetical protein
LGVKVSNHGKDISEKSGKIRKNRGKHMEHNRIDPNGFQTNGNDIMVGLFDTIMEKWRNSDWIETVLAEKVAIQYGILQQQ